MPILHLKPTIRIHAATASRAIALAALRSAGRLFTALAVVSSARLAAHATEKAPSQSPAFRLPAPEPPVTRDYRSDPPDARIGTHLEPQLHAPWLAPAIGADARVTGNVGFAFAAEGVAAVPFQLWRGGFDPGFFPTLRASWRGKSTLDLSTGFGFGIFEDAEGYRDGWKTLSYTPQIAWRLTGPDATVRGFRHDLVFKPDLVHIAIAHCFWPNDDSPIHELRLVVGTSILEEAL